MKTKRFLVGLFCMPLLASCSFINDIKEKIFPSNNEEEKPVRVEITGKEERKKAVAEIKQAIDKTNSANSYKFDLQIASIFDIRIVLSLDKTHQNYITEGYYEGEKQAVAYGEMYDGKLAIYNQDLEDNSWFCVEYEQEEFKVDPFSGLSLQSSSMDDELDENIRLYKEGNFYIQELGGTKDALINLYKDLVDEEYKVMIDAAADQLEDFQLIIGIKDGYYVYEEYKMSDLEPVIVDDKITSFKAETYSLYIGGFSEINTLSVQRPDGVIVPPEVVDSGYKEENTEEPKDDEPMNRPEEPVDEE